MNMDRIEEILRRNGDATAKALCAALGVSQPTFSRMVAKAAAVVSYGAKSETRYTIATPRNGFANVPIYVVDEGGRVSSFGTLRPVTGERFVFQPASGITNGSSQIHDGLPWFIADIRPQGFIGRHFPQTHADLRLPDSITEWDEGHVLTAIAQRGEDFPGNLIVGAESLARYLRMPNKVATARSEYPRLAAQALGKDVNTSSAGGEQPKFTCANAAHDLIVKFSPPVNSSPAAQRWADLLVCEHIANTTLRTQGIAAAETEIMLIEGRVFMESTRFDRTRVDSTPAGRKGMVSLSAIDAEFTGYGSGWVRSATALLKQKKIDQACLNTIVVLDLFDRMIGNSDMHLGNLSFFTNDFKSFRLAPVYDMLPMMFAPSSQGEISPKEFLPPTPTPEQIAEWMAASNMAIAFWQEVAQAALVSAKFQQIAKGCRDTLVLLQQAATRVAFVKP